MDSEPIPGHENKAIVPRRRSPKPRKRDKDVAIDHPLTDFELRFADEYLIIRNATQAVLNIKGNSIAYNTGMTQGSQLLAKPNVRHYIECRLNDISEKYDAKLETLIGALKAWTFCDPLEMFKDGKMLDIDKMPPHIRSAISSLEVEELFEGNGEDRQMIGYLKKVKFVSKEKAAELLAKYSGIDLQISKPPKPGDPNTVTHFHTSIPFEKIRQKAAG